MNPKTLAKLRDYCRDDQAFEQLTQDLQAEFQPLRHSIEQAGQQQALFRVISRIRESLDLETIFQTTAIEVRQLLQADRVGMFRFYPETGWDDGEFVSEDVNPIYTSAIAHKIHDHCFGDQFAIHYEQGRIQNVADIHNAGLSDCHIRILSQFQVRANLVVPLLQGQKLWGLLCIHQCSTPRQWQSIEIEFVNQIANHLGIALQQAEFLAELQIEVTERQQAQEKAQALNQGLRQAIAELKAVNHELESFSYSVSHDLRAPLRSVDGFSQALLEDCHDQLDDIGQDYLHRIRAATQRMGHLIDDLLTLSRVIRSEIQIESVNLSRLTSSICNELQRTHVDRQMEFVIQPGLYTLGDERLLQVVLENLLSNAVKFTSKHSHARIELGTITQKDGRLVYFVRDDGVGFDMNYADKLFSPFQRLHGMQEFQGNGIGLATVQRVVRRHGGRVWAEGVVEGGATFYFTLAAEEISS